MILKRFISSYFRLMVSGVLLFSCSAIFAQEVEFEHIDKTQGLPSNYVTSIIQDKYGMMWFGTFSGLVRFDGFNYKVFQHKDSDSASLADNLIRSLHLTKEGDLLVANENHGFSIFDYQTEKFTRYTHKENNTNSLQNNNIISVLIDSKGIIWIGTWEGINRFDPVSKTFNFYKIKSNIANHDEREFISSVLEERSGKLLLYSTGSRIIRFTPSTQTYDYIKLPDLPKPKLRLNKGGVLFVDKFGFVWIGTELNGLIRLDPKTFAIKHYNVENGKLSSNILLCMMQDSKGRLWAGTDGGGLLSYNYKTDSFTAYTYDAENPNSVSGNAIYSVYEDKDGHIWAGAYASGLNVLKNNKRKFECYSNNGLKGRKLSYKSVLSFAQADSGNIYIGTDGGGLNIFNPETKNISYYNNKNSNICFDIVKSLLRDSKGNLWLGSFGKGLCILDIKRKVYSAYSPFESSKANTISHVNVWTMKEDKDSNVWIGFLDAGLNKYVPSQNKFEKYLYNTSTGTGLTDGSIMSMFIDNKNNVWAGTESGGLCLMDSSRKIFTAFTKTKDSASLPSNNITALMQDSKDRIWVGTKDGGLSLLLSVREKKFKSYNQKNGLPGNSVCSIEEDLNGNLWLGTENGLAFFNTQTEKIQNFTKSDGLQSMEFAKSASLKDTKGYLYFGGTDGFNRFHPDSLSYNTSLPNVYIAGIRLFNNPVEAGQSYNGKIYYTKPAHLLDTLHLNYTDYVFSLDFTCTDFTNPEKNKFAYKLEGFDTEWNYVNATSRTSTYTNLKSGTYKYRVIASNSDGLWNNEGATLIVIVHPPFYETWWFRVAGGILFIAFLIGFYYFRIRSIRKQNIRLSRQVRVKTSELQRLNTQLLLINEQTINSNIQLEEQQVKILKQKVELEDINEKLNQLNDTKDKLFSIIGHDLRNPVSALSSLTGMLQQNFTVLNEREKLQIVDHIQTSATSLKILVTNLLNWALVQGKNLAPSPEPVNLAKITEDCFKLLKLHAIGKNILLKNDCNTEHMAFADSEMIQTILRNLVSNAIKFTERGGSISISTKLNEDETVSLEVMDTGSGMDIIRVSQLLSKEKIVSTKGTSQEKGTGIGLVIVKEFTEANGGQLEVDSQLGQGTTFRIFLPADKQMVV